MEIYNSENINTDMKHIVYITVNLLNQKFYIGVHKLGKKYSYLGSGKLLKLAIEKYGKNNFLRYTLFEFSNPKLAYAKEAEIVDRFFIERNDTYNLALGGRGSHPKSYKFSNETREYLSKISSGQDNNFYGKSHTKSTKSAMSTKKLGANNHMSKSICVDGISYDSIRMAAKALNLPYSSLVKKHKYLQNQNYSKLLLETPLSKIMETKAGFEPA